MSRKNRNRSPRISPHPPASPDSRRLMPSGLLQRDIMLSSLRSAEDGYSNSAAFIGEDSPLISAGTFKRNNLTSRTNLLTTAYRESWLAKRIIDMPSEDMTRKWYTLHTSLGEEEINELRRLEAQHSVRQELTNAIRWARLYGGSIAVMVLRDDEDLSVPLDPDLLLPDCFKGVLVLDRAQGISPSLETVADLDDPDFGEPEYYTVDLDMGDIRSVRVHHSRVLKFTGRELPRIDYIAENYWGASELEHVWEELQKRYATSANIAQLVFQANITTLKISDFSDKMVYGQQAPKDAFLELVEKENRFRTSYGLQILSKDDSMENLTYGFAGLSNIYESFMMDMAGASEIPATKLFGRSPEGFNSNGLSDLKNYAEMISGLQERMLRPALAKLLPVMAISCWGFVPEDLDFTFDPIIEATPDERAALENKLSSSVISAFTAGLISREDAIEELKARGGEIGVWGKLKETWPVPGGNVSSSGNDPDPVQEVLTPRVSS